MARHRDAKNRRQCLQKKANEYHQKFSAQAAVIIKDQDTWYTYTSPGFLADFINSLHVPWKNRSGPDDYDSVRERNRRTNSPSSSASSLASSSSYGSSPIPSATPACSASQAPGQSLLSTAADSPALSFESLFGSSPPSDASTPTPRFPALTPSASGPTTPRCSGAEVPSSVTHAPGTVDPTCLEKPRVHGPGAPRRPPALGMRTSGVLSGRTQKSTKRGTLRREYFE